MKRVFARFPFLALFLGCAFSARAFGGAVSTGADKQNGQSAEVAASYQDRAYFLKDGASLSYSNPDFLKTMGSAPADFGGFIADSFKKDKLPWLAAITASTLILIEYDQKIYDNTRRFGERQGVSSKDKTRTFLKIGGVSVLRGPTDAGSAMYFLGDGWVNLGLLGGFETYGWLKDDWRSRQTGHQLAEGLIVTGFSTQVLKRVTGRETPRASTAPRGVWRFFPSFKDFQGHRTRYDAFPSGHLATCMMTLTIIAENYPEKKYIKPLGYSLLTLLSFQMVNNGVHWASDYPLGLAIGYGVGKAIARTGRTAARRGLKSEAALRLGPYLSADGFPGAALSLRF